MKKLIIPLIAAALLAVTSGAQAAPVTAVAPSNVVTTVNVQLTFTSSVSNYTTYATNIIEHISGTNKTKITNVVSTTVYTSVKTPVTTKEVIAAILGSNAPVGATLAYVQNTNSTTNSGFYIRLHGTNFVKVPTTTLSSTGSGPSVTSGTEKYFESTGKYTFVGTQWSINTVTFSTAKLSFTGTAVQTRSSTGDAIVVDGSYFDLGTLTLSIIGTGTDSIGSGEIVTGTISADGGAVGT